MSLLIPTKIMASDGEETIRQYRCAKLKSEFGGLDSSAIIAVTNKRLILYAEPKSSKNPVILQHEVYIDNIAGVSFFTGRPLRRTGVGAAFAVMFVFFALLSAIFYWQAEPLFTAFNVGVHLTFENFRLIGTAAPMALYLLIALLYVLLSKKNTMSVSVYTKALSDSNINLKGGFTPSTNSFYVQPNHKETRRMFSELSSIIIDIQNGNSLKYLATENDAHSADD